MNPEIGRLPAEELEKEIVYDGPQKATQAINTLLDQIIDALKASALSAEPAIVALEKLKFKL
jgi:hypothetical protein